MDSILITQYCRSERSQPFATQRRAADLSIQLNEGTESMTRKASDG